MQNNYGVKKRFLACFLKILDKKRKKWRQVKNSCQTLGPASKKVLPDLLFF
jgi:hypothetical protein